jgi:uncharacterized HhH-GPD family protein
MAPRKLHLSGDAQADALLSKDHLGLLIGMVLDQQIRLEQAFWAPYALQERLGTTLDARRLAAMDPAELGAIFSTPPALHRFPGSMAARVQALCAVLVAEYGGRPDRVWKGVKDADELLARIKALPGFGDQKARIFLALLGKQLGVTPEGWEKASAPFSEPGSRRSVADIVDPASMTEVRAFKQALKAEAKAQAAQGTAAAPGGRAKRAPAAKTGARARRAG